VNGLKRVFANFSVYNEITLRKLDEEISLPKTQSKLAQHQKNNQLFCRNNRLFIPIHNIKLKLKSSRDREIEHTGLYYITLSLIQAISKQSPTLQKPNQ